MENMISSKETAQKPQQRFGMGACPHALVPAAASAINGAVAIPRPRTGMAVGFAEQHLALAATGRGAWLRLSATNSKYMTLITASGAGALGTHPARDPV